jgi:hypothetical protein
MIARPARIALAVRAPSAQNSRAHWLSRIHSLHERLMRCNVNLRRGAGPLVVHDPFRRHVAVNVGEFAEVDKPRFVGKLLKPSEVKIVLEDASCTDSDRLHVVRVVQSLERDQPSHDARERIEEDAVVSRIGGRIILALRVNCRCNSFDDELSNVLGQLVNVIAVRRVRSIRHLPLPKKDPIRDRIVGKKSAYIPVKPMHGLCEPSPSVSRSPS